MSGVKVTNEQHPRPIANDFDGVTGTDDGDDNFSWDPGITTEIPPGNDPGDVLTWDGDSWEPEPPEASLTVQDEGSPLATAATTLNFVGAGVTASGTGPTKTITIPGESSSIAFVAASGPAVTIDYSLARKWDITITENVTYTFSNFPATGSWGEVEIVRRGGPGAPFTETWPAELDWPDTTDPQFGGGPAPDCPDEGGQHTVQIVTEDGGTSYGGSYDFALSGGTVAAADVTIADAGSYYTGTDVEAALQEIGAEIATLGSSSAGGHAHVAEETHLSDGSTTTWTLDQNFEPGSVIAWNTTTIARLSVTEVPPDQATVSAAGSSGDRIVFDYAATIA